MSKFAMKMVILASIVTISVYVLLLEIVKNL